MTVGDRIRIRRIELGMTQEELSKKIGCNTRSAISRVERNKNETSVKLVEKIAEALYCKPAYLLGWAVKEEVLSELSTDEAVDLLSPEYLQLLKIIRNLNEEHQTAIIEQAEFFTLKERS